MLAVKKAFPLKKLLLDLEVCISMTAVVRRSRLTGDDTLYKHPWIPLPLALRLSRVAESYEKQDQVENIKLEKRRRP